MNSYLRLLEQYESDVRNLLKAGEINLDLAYQLVYQTYTQMGAWVV